MIPLKWALSLADPKSRFRYNFETETVVHILDSNEKSI